MTTITSSFPIKNIKLNISMKNFLKQTLTGFATVTCICLLIPHNIIAKEPAAKLTSKVLLASDVKWKPLNPARGDKGPKAGSLWGDFTDSGSSGFLVKFVDGFSSPPHIHNITYRGVVIKGLIHNDDPDAADRWMHPGSYWTQPKGEVHITSAKGNSTMAYIEIEEGPYLVLPVMKAFDSKEKPIKVDASKITWSDPYKITPSGNGPKVAFLWGNPNDDQSKGTLVQLPAGFVGKMVSQGSTFRAVIIKGKTKHRITVEANFQTLSPGSYFHSKGESKHHVSCELEKDCIIYVNTNDKFDILSKTP